MNREDAIALAKVRLEEVLTFFGVNTSVRIEEGDDRIELLVETADSAQLIGHRGENLRALQHVLNMILRNQSDERIYWGVDIAGYKKARGEAVMAKAREQALKVIETGDSITLAPMNAAERRLVHMVVSELEGIESESAGTDPKRYVIIKPV